MFPFLPTDTCRHTHTRDRERERERERDSVIKKTVKSISNEGVLSPWSPSSLLLRVCDPVTRGLRAACRVLSSSGKKGRSPCSLHKTFTANYACKLEHASTWSENLSQTTTTTKKKPKWVVQPTCLPVHDPLKSAFAVTTRLDSHATSH